MLITPKLIQDLQAGFNTRFQLAYTTAPVVWDQIATQVPSTADAEVYAMMARLPKMRKWVGPRIMNNIVGHALRVVNETWEDSLAIPREHLEDDRLGWTAPRIDALGAAAAAWPDDMLVTAIQANVVGFDGKAFFATDHPLDPAGVQSNTLTLPLTADNYRQAREKLSTFKGEDGQPLEVGGSLLVVPPQLEYTARTILEAELIPNPAGTAPQSNVLRNSAKLLVWKKLSNAATTWYLFETSLPVKPWIYQLRRAPEMHALTDPNSELVFHLNRFEWGVDARGAIAPGPWWLGLRSVG